MKQNSKKSLAVIGALVVLLALLASLKFFWPRFQSHENPPPSLTTEEARRHGPCPGKVEILTADDPLMAATFPIGTKFRVIWNWYACHEVQRDDWIYFRYSLNRPPMIRTARGIPGDQFSISFDAQKKAWNVIINDVLLRDPNGTPHFFGSASPPLLSLYVKSLRGHLGAKNVILFSDFSPGDFDSGTLGVVNQDDFLGKVEKPTNQDP